MGIAQSLYDRSPVLLQHLLVTARGSQLRRLRYTPHTWRYFEFLMESQHWSLERLEAYQFERLCRLVDHAQVHSPYYRERYAPLDLRGGPLASLADIRRLPVLTKEEFRRHTDLIVSTKVDRDKMWVAYTSGTSGMPLRAYHTHENMQQRIAAMERLYHWYNPRRWRKRASFTGKLVVHPDASTGPFHRSNLAIRQQLYSSHHLTPANLPRYGEELCAFAPEQIDGIASPIYVVADHLLRSGRAGCVQPKVVIPTSETLLPYLRERIEKAFQCRVADQYGSQEGAPLAYQCPEGGFHVCPETGVFEILRADDSECVPGEVGRLVVTSFLSEGTPLIRYDIGDMAAWSGVACCCGRQMPTLLGVEGRLDDMFYTRERGIVPRVDSAFKSLPSSIIATQVAQVGSDHFEVRIVPDPEQYAEEHGHSLIKQLHSYLGGSVRIELRILAEIPRTAGGKLRAMVNECSDPEVANAISNAWNRSLGGHLTESDSAKGARSPADDPFRG